MCQRRYRREAIIPARNVWDGCCTVRASTTVNTQRPSLFQRSPMSGNNSYQISQLRGNCPSATLTWSDWVGNATKNLFFARISFACGTKRDRSSFSSRVTVWHTVLQAGMIGPACDGHVIPILTDQLENTAIVNGAYAV
jgi:hypothetical protein